MKKLLTIFVALFLGILGTHAQEMSVQSFYLAETDLTANTPGTMVHDQNGNVCALIKVETTHDGFNFDVGALGVSEVKRVGGEMWVYVPFGVRKITISHHQLGVIRDYQFPCAIEKGRTYIMKLFAGTVRTVIEHAVTRQFLYVELDPADAILEINGKIKATDNGVYQELMQFGKYTYKAYSQNYHDLVGIIEISDPVNRHDLSLKLRAAFGHLSVLPSSQQDLAGAVVYVDEKYIGQVPVRDLQLSSGSHSIRIIKEMYEAYNETFTISDEEKKSLTPVLVPDFAEVTLVTGDEADIYINGERKGTRTWTGRLASGSYLFESRQQGHLPYQMPYDISRLDQSKTIRIQDPTPIYGSLVISSTPAKAKITVDGEYVGDTPKFIANQIIGQHTVAVELEEYEPQVRTVEIKEGEESTLSFTLEPKKAGIAAQISDITFEHNVYKNNVKGMKVLVDFTVQGMKDGAGRCVAYFYYPDGSVVKDTNKSYCTTTGETSSGSDFKPGYDNAKYTDFEIFIPYSELEVPSDVRDLKLLCCIWENSDSSWNELVKSNYYSFVLPSSGSSDSSSASSLTKSAQFTDITIEHDVYKDNVRGMKILADFTVQGMKDKSGSCVAYFYYQNGDKLKDTNDSYCTTGGSVCASKEIKPNYDNARYTDLEIFIPYSELEVVSGKRDLKVSCTVWDKSVSPSKALSSSRFYSFTLPSSAVANTSPVSKTIEKKAQFKDVTIEHNVYKDNVKGMKILADFNIQGMKDKSGSCVAYFYYQNGDKLKDTNDSYCTSAKSVCAYTNIKPGYDDASYTDLEIFIPNSELEVVGTGKHELKLSCTIWDESVSPSKPLVTSQYYNFTLTK